MAGPPRSFSINFELHPPLPFIGISTESFLSIMELLTYRWLMDFQQILLMMLMPVVEACKISSEELERQSRAKDMLLASAVQCLTHFCRGFV